MMHLNSIILKLKSNFFGSIFRAIIYGAIILQLYLIFGTPFYFNNLSYDLANKRSFSNLTTDPSSIRELLKSKNEKMYLGEMTKKTYSICYIHGFSASRMELEPVISNVAKMLDANLFFTRLTGHGYLNSDVLKKVKAQSWVNDSIECLEVAYRTGHKVILVGTSMGGALASLVAVNTKYKIHSLILISPYFGIKDRKADLLAGYYGGEIADFYFNGYRSFKPVNDQQKLYWTTKYPSSVLKQLMIVNMAVRNTNFSTITSPVFIAYSKQDEILDLDQIHIKYRQIKSKKRIDADETYTSHILAGDIVNPQGTGQLQKNIYGFIKSIY